MVRCTEVRFVRFLSSGFTTMAVINPPENKLAKRTSVQECNSFLPEFYCDRTKIQDLNKKEFEIF